ncbi:MAG: type II toxin-antitoxin system PemK/MazF family toxin [Candidatus Parcubacteria bacterium]|uniref:type II toxin-antitoxin system PemK/MazF family toxin n=1 Tax=Phormidesmis priestleyi TaxID=268141 RepID=UPI00083AD126|nr:type II toxin-antitoxin system PemK/MazF family toxin [Phormidesmis priestleyi]MBC7824569.1 type II toxin-antitoxin system PemK/MazF family toxin [Leptolyngbyaceae cyanobacterium LF-bin-113]
MKRSIVLVEFPYDDLSDSKIRPAYALTNPIGEHRHVVLALITSRLPTHPLATDLILDATHPDFAVTGLKKTSVLRLNHLLTLRHSMIQRQLGGLSTKLISKS